jgi:hypothetical protein
MEASIKGAKVVKVLRGRSELPRRLDKASLLMEVRMGSVLCLLTVCLHTLLALSCELPAPATHEDIGVAPRMWR